MSALGAAFLETVLEKYDGLYRGLASRQNGEPVPFRQKSWERFQHLGFPRDGDERWKYTKPSKLFAETFGLPQKSTPPAAWKELIEKRLGPANGATRFVFVHARFQNDLSSQESLTPGLRVQSLREALGDFHSPSVDLLGQDAGQEHRALAALNGAFLEDGAWIHLDKGCVPQKAIELVFLSGGKGERLMSNPRTVILMDEGSCARVQEIYLGAQGEPYFTNAVSQVYLGQNCRLDHLRLQMENADAQHISSLAIQQGRDSFYGSSHMCLGAALSRTELEITLDGSGAECHLIGLSLGERRQHGDMQTEVNHLGPHGTSRQFFKSILDDQSTGVFNGSILVKKKAQKTNASQVNRNLLLSKGARINTKPQLEIFADDVKCQHGDTVGSLDEDAMYYMRSRGLDQAEAKQILIQAFAQDVLDLVPLGSFRSLAENRIQKWFQSRHKASGDS